MLDLVIRPIGMAITMAITRMGIIDPIGPMAITTAPGTTGIMGIMGIGFTVTTVIITIATNLSVEDKFNGAGSEAISSQLFFFVFATQLSRFGFLTTE